MLNWNYKSSALSNFVLFLGEPDCTDRGTCVRENGASVCKCQVGFAADDCSELVCQGQPMCSDHGKTDSMTEVSLFE